jgi:hypothetical protein
VHRPDRSIADQPLDVPRRIGGEARARVASIPAQLAAIEGGGGITRQGLAPVEPFDVAALGLLDALTLDTGRAFGTLDALALDTSRAFGMLDTLAFDPDLTFGTLDALPFDAGRTFRSLDVLALDTGRTFRALDVLAFDALRPLGALHTLAFHPLRPLGPLDLGPLRPLRAFRALGLLAFGTLRALRLALVAAVARLSLGTMPAALGLGRCGERKTGNAGNQEQLASHYILLAKRHEFST